MICLNYGSLRDLPSADSSFPARVLSSGIAADMAYLDENFFLQSGTARRLFHEVAKDQPIIDYHCHLSPRRSRTNQRWDNLADIWLGGDHYKWRLLRANGIGEELITGAPRRARSSRPGPKRSLTRSATRSTTGPTSSSSATSAST
jgi:hypothetical protein